MGLDLGGQSAGTVDGEAYEPVGVVRMPLASLNQRNFEPFACRPLVITGVERCFDDFEGWTAARLLEV